MRNKLQWNLNHNTKRFIHENASENTVCEMAAILSKRGWVLIHVLTFQPSKHWCTYRWLFQSSWWNRRNCIQEGKNSRGSSSPHTINQGTVGTRKANIREPLQWRHNELDAVSIHQPHDCLLSRLFRRKSKKTSKLRVTGLCAGNSPVTGEFPTQRASNAENDDVIIVGGEWCMETLSRLLAFCKGNSPTTGVSPSQRTSVVEL